MALSIGVLLAIGIVSARALDRPGPSPRSGSTTTSTAHHVFSFTASKAPGWTPGPGNNTSQVLFERVQDCFVSLTIQATSVATDPTTAAALTSLRQQGYTVTADATELSSLTVNRRPTPVTMQTYSVSLPSGPTNSSVYPGQAFGVARDTKQVIAIEGYCRVPSDLAGIATAISAVSYQR